MKGRATHLTLVRDAAALAEAACSEIVKCANEAIAARGVFHIALAGGSTPRATYKRLARAGWTADFARWHVWFGDERCVPPEHADSNFRLACETWLTHVDIARTHVHRIRGESGDALAAADEYERELIWTLDQPLPRLDLVLLGLGADGHTASLFPGSDALHERERLVLATWVEHLGAHRITLTPRAINAARRVLFLVSGSSKAKALRMTLAGDANTPATAIAPRTGTVHWLADRAAAAVLNAEHD